MTRYFLDEEAQARFADDRFDVIRRLGRVAVEERCEFLVVAGDVFESGRVDRRTIARALEALASVPVPVFLLPGNHDPLDAVSVYRRPAFRERAPSHVHVLADAAPVEVRPGVEVVGAPWPSKRPLRDLAASAVAPLAPAPGAARVLVAHGGIDALAPERSDPAAIGLAALEAALASQRVHYAALGDRHSLTRVGASGRVFYAGAPEPTDFDEVEPGHALVVELDEGRCVARPRRVGAWRFERLLFDVAGCTDLDALEEQLAAAEGKDRTVLRLALVGSLSLRAKARLDAILDAARDLFAAIDVAERESELVVVPDDGDFRDLDLAGFASRAARTLRVRASGEGPEAETARDALALLVRLAAGVA